MDVVISMKQALKPTASLKEICEYISQFHCMPAMMSIEEYQKKYAAEDYANLSSREERHSGVEEFKKAMLKSYDK